MAMTAHPVQYFGPSGGLMYLDVDCLYSYQWWIWQSAYWRYLCLIQVHVSRCVGQLIGFADISKLSTHNPCVTSIILVLVNCVLPARDSNCPQQRPGEPGNLGSEDLGLLSSKSRLHLWVIHYCVCTLPTWLPRAETTQCTSQILLCWLATSSM